MSLQAQIAMRKRQQRAFRDLPWRRPEHGPAMVTTEPQTKTAKERTLDLVGKPAPSWVTKKVQKAEKGKPALVYVGFNWLGPTHAAARMANTIAAKGKGRVAVFGIVNAHSFRDQFRFFAGVRRLQHRVHWVREHTIREWNLPGCPAILVLDASGTVTFACVGFFPEKTEEAVKKALGL